MTVDVLLSRLFEKYGAIELNLSDDLLPRLVDLAEGKLSYSDNISIFKSLYETDHIQKRVVEECVCDLLQAHLMPPKSRYDMFVESDDFENPTKVEVTKVEVKGSNLQFHKGRNGYLTRAIGLKFNIADKFYNVKMVQHEQDGRPIALISQFHPALFDDKFTVNAFATPFISTMGYKQEKKGFEYTVTSSRNMPYSRSGEILSIVEIHDKTARTDSTISRQQILEQLGVSSERLAQARADVLAHRANIKKLKL